MRKIKTYLRSFCLSITDKPLVFVIFIITIMISAVASGCFYRLTKNEVLSFENRYYYNVGYKENFDSVKFYENIKGSNIVTANQSYVERDIIFNEESGKKDLGINYYKEFAPSKTFFFT